MKPHTRYGPFLIGILTGMYLTTKNNQLLKEKVKTSDYSNIFVRITKHFLYTITLTMCVSCVLLLVQWQAALGWFCCLSLMAVLVGLAYVLKETPAYPSVPHALYQGLHRPLWALALTWIIFACEEGYGGKLRAKMSKCNI